jgi:hypothetical protein
MRPWFAVIGVGVAVVATYAYQARAGYKTSNSSRVHVYSNRADGALGATRNSSDVTEYIGCEMYTYGTLYCRASDAGANTVSCWTSDPEFIALGRSINIDSWVEFDFDANGTCNFLVVDKGSWYPGKNP